MTSVTEPAADHVVDIHTTAGKLADLRKRAEESKHPVGEAAVEKVHAKGKLTARERIELLLDPDAPFLELSPLAAWGTDFTVGASVVVGIGAVEGV